MADMHFSEYIERERQRLQADRESVFNQQQQLDGKLAEINRELSAIEAYESAKTGKAAAPARQARGRGTQRATRRGSKRDELLSVIRDSQGLSRGEILEKMGLKGNKSGEMSVSNALTALTKTGQVSRDGGKYHLPL